MEITITGKQMRVTQTLKRYIHERARKAEKYLAPRTHLAFTLKKEKYRQLAEVHANLNGFVLQAEEETDQIHASVDQAMAKIERQLHRHKEKILDHRAHRNGNRRFAPETRQAPTLVSPPGLKRKAVRTPARAGDQPTGRPPSLERETIHMAILTLEEALLQMASGKKEFLLFRNRSDQPCQLLYRPSGGSLRLAEVIG